MEADNDFDHIAFTDYDDMSIINDLESGSKSGLHCDRRNLGNIENLDYYDTVLVPESIADDGHHLQTQIGTYVQYTSAALKESRRGYK